MINKIASCRLAACICFCVAACMGNAGSIAVPNFGFDNVAVDGSHWQYVKDQTAGGGEWGATKDEANPWICDNSYDPEADGGLAADSGNQKVEMNAGYVHQWLTNTFVAGRTYTLTCRAHAKNSGQRAYLYLFNEYGNLGADSNNPAMAYADISQDSQWHTVTLSYVASAGDDGKVIGVQIYGRSDTFVDTVTLADDNVPADPEYDEPTQDLTAAFEDAAEFILAQAGISNRSYCCVFGARRGDLMRELAERSQLYITGFEPKTDNLDAARQMLGQENLYGTRAMVHSGSLFRAPYSDYCAALVVSDAVLAYGLGAGSAAEFYRLIRPAGGVGIVGQPVGVSNALTRVELETWLDAGGVINRTIIENSVDGLWAVIRRGPLAGAGEWTQLWGDPGNKACSGDMRTTNSYDVLWFGEPGPRVLIDRHNRPHAPLYKAGRMVIPGDGVIVCVDAYNGARLWDLAVPGASKVAILRDAGWLTMDDSHIFAAVEDRCLKINLNSGQVEATWSTPTPLRDWGYVSIESNAVYGSEQIDGASYIGPVGYNSNSEVLIAYGGYKPIITSKALFSLDRETGAQLWHYATNSVIANPSICRDAGSIYFYESYNAAAVADADGRVKLADFKNGSSEYLVKLNAQTGAVVWRIQKEIPFEHILHLSYADGVLVGSGSSGSTVSYNLRAYNSSDGSDKWSQDIPQSFGATRDHGEQDKHAMIVGDTVVLKYGSYNLHTGADAGFSFGTSSCADCSASGKHIFARVSGNPGAVNVATHASQRISTVIRPGCYISIIPAGGVVMLPAFSSGCTCNFPVQTTITWKPKQ